MQRRAVLKTPMVAALALPFAGHAVAQTMDPTSQVTFDTVMAFMGAMGKGDMKTLTDLMANDMVWMNEGDKAMPWIGPWEGKEEILKFRLFMAVGLSNGQLSYESDQRGVSAQWPGIQNVVLRMLLTPGGQWFWTEFRRDYPLDYQVEIDRLIEEGRVS